MQKRRLIIIVLGIALLAGAWLFWSRWRQETAEAVVASGNGRIEAVEINVATKAAGRVKEILVEEGEFVTAGQVVAKMDTEVLEAELRAAEAARRQAESAVVTARSQVQLREAEKSAAVALLGQREAEHDIAAKRLARSSRLVQEGASPQQAVDDDTALMRGAVAAVSAAKAQIAAAEAAIATAHAGVSGAESAVEAAKAATERLHADLADSVLRAPRDGRIQYRIAQTGEVVGGGGRVLNMIDLGDVYITFFLPTSVAGRLAIGTEVRIVLDTAPDYVIPASVSFVADVAQFTPKTVETASEREKLMFRVRAHIPPELLRKYILRVKAGLPGVAYVALDPAAPWPARLETRLPP